MYKISSLVNNSVLIRYLVIWVSVFMGNNLVREKKIKNKNKLVFGIVLGYFG